MEKNNDLCGVINIYKNQDFTSHDVVAILRKILGTKKIGHTGTLDPMAEGVLPICIGKATKIADYVTDGKKQYFAIIKLGISTDTEDIWGEVIEEKNVVINKTNIEKAVHSFIGDILQTPPMYSAIKINGQKLYDLARQGKTIERKKRLINISNIEITNINENTNEISILVDCSKGTYIRTLCKDIGEKLGYPACMAKLIRTKSGEFTIENSITLDDLKIYVENNNYLDKIIIVSEVLKYRKAIADSCENKHLYNGNKINVKNVNISDFKKDEKFLIYDDSNTLIGVFGIDETNTWLKPTIMLLK